MRHRANHNVLIWLGVFGMISPTFGATPRVEYGDFFLRLSDAPAAEWVAGQKNNDQIPSAKEQQRYQQRLEDRQRPVNRQLESIGIPVVWAYQRALNGLQVHCPISQQLVLMALSDVTDVIRMPVDKLALDDSVPLLGLPSIWENDGLDGSGVQIGIVDSGIDYIHASFGGPGTAEAYQANDPALIDDTFNDLPLFPTDKVVGGYDFVGSDYDPSSSDVAVPDPDPIPDGEWDDETWVLSGHGTHVASTAAGLPYDGGHAGVAPGAQLWALKVFANDSTTMTLTAVDWATDPNQDGDLSDALDILNLSLGSGFSGDGGDQNALYSEALNNFMALGSIVVASAGNSGNRPFASSVPSGLPGVIAVANSFATGERGTFVRVDEPSDWDEYDRYYRAWEAKDSLAPSLEEIGDVAGTLIDCGHGCTAEDFPETVSGQIPLIQRGECEYIDKFTLAEAAGATAIVVYQHQDKNPHRMGGEPKGAIPGVMIHKARGEYLRDLLGDGQTVTITVSSDLPWHGRTDAVHSSSSRGPAYPWTNPEGNRVSAKPDITAPGANINAAEAGTGTENVNKSGTSMAAPHVSGVAALARQLHPDWTPREIKALLMNTAHVDLYQGENVTYGGNGSLAPVSLGGAGRVDPSRALQSDIIAYSDPEVTIDWGLQVLSETTTLSRTVTIANKGESSITLDATLLFRTPKDNPEWVTATVEPPQITVEGQTTATTTIQWTVEPAQAPEWKVSSLGTSNATSRSGNYLTANEVDGFLELTPATDTSDAVEATIRVPFYMLLRKPTTVDTSMTCLAPSPHVGTAQNLGPGEAKLEFFTLFVHDEDQPDTPNTADIRAIGLKRGTYGKKEALAFAIQTYDYRMLTHRSMFFIFLDMDQDATADFLLLSADKGFTNGNGISGRPESLLLTSTDIDGNGGYDVHLSVGAFDIVGKYPLVSDVLTSNAILTAPLEVLGLDGDDHDFNFWVASYDLSGKGIQTVTPVDLIPAEIMPMHLLFSTSHISVDLDCMLWELEDDVVTGQESIEFPIVTSPTCGIDGETSQFTPAGMMALTNGAPGVDEAILIQDSAITTDIGCRSELTIPVPASACAVTFDPTNVIEPGNCTYVLTAQSNITEPLPLGTREIAVGVSDPWGHSTLCKTTVTVVDVMPPSLVCPLEAIEVTPGSPVSLEAHVTDPCEASTVIGEVHCNDAGGNAVPCDPIRQEASIHFDKLAASIASVTWRVESEDSSGNKLSHDCVTPVIQPPPGPSNAGTGGCQTMPSRPAGRTPLTLWWAIFGLGWCVRRMYSTGRNDSL